MTTRRAGTGLIIGTFVDMTTSCSLEPESLGGDTAVPVGSIVHSPRNKTRCPNSCTLLRPINRLATGFLSTRSMFGKKPTHLCQKMARHIPFSFRGVDSTREVFGGRQEDTSCFDIIRCVETRIRLLGRPGSIVCFVARRVSVTARTNRPPT